MTSGAWWGIFWAALIAVTAIVLRWFPWSKLRKRPAPVENPYEALRALSFRVTPSDVGATPSDELPHVWGVTMELRMSGAIVTLVSFGDGTTSMYLSSGGGVLGGNQIPALVAASKNFVRQAEEYFDAATPCTETPTPQPGKVRFYLKCFDGVRYLEADAAPLTGGTHPWSPLFQSADAVLTELRLSSQGKRPPSAGA